MEMHLAGSHKATYDAVFQHPVARNLKWVDVRSMLIALAESVDEHNDVLKISRHGKTLMLHRPNRSGMDDIAELMKVRHFLEHSTAPEPKPVADGIHLLIVIDHRVARVYRTELHGTIPQKVVPYDPSGAGRHLHYVENDSNGQRKPERKSFYDAVATAAHDAAQILVFGSGTGASSAMNQLIDAWKLHHKELAARVIGSIVVNEQHLSDDQLLAQAREFYASKPTVQAEKESS